MEPRGGKLPAQTDRERAVSQGHVPARRTADPDNLAGYRGIGVVASPAGCLFPGTGCGGCVRHAATAAARAQGTLYYSIRLGNNVRGLRRWRWGRGGGGEQRKR